MSKIKLLTILIPTFNSEKFLPTCLRSIEKQCFKNFQIFCVDGGSKDRTLKIIKNSKLNIKIISKKDKSFEDGVNKSFRYIKTNFFMIIGSDDFLGGPNYIKNLYNIIKNNKYHIVFSQYGEVLNKRKKIILQSNDFSCLNYKTVVPGLGWIGTKEILKSAKYSCKLKVATDYDFFLKLYKKKFNFFRTNKSVYYFRLGANSFRNALLGYYEQKTIGLRNNGSKLRIYFTYYFLITKFYTKFVILNLFFNIRN